MRRTMSHSLSWQKAYHLYNHIQTNNSNRKIEPDYKSQAEQKKRMTISDENVAGPVKSNEEIKTQAGKTKKTTKKRTVNEKEARQHDENEHRKQKVNENLNSQKLERNCSKEERAVENPKHSIKNQTNAETTMNSRLPKTDGKSKSAVKSRIIKVKQAEKPETAKPENDKPAKHGRPNSETKPKKPDEQAVEGKHTISSCVEKKSDVINRKNVSIQVNVEETNPKHLVNPSHQMTHTVATQTSQTLLDLTKGKSIENSIEHSTTDVHSAVIKRLTVGQNKSLLWVNQNKTDLIPPTPDGPRFSQEGSQLTYTHPGVQNEMLKHLHALQTKGIMCDVLIRCDDIDFKAHKVVLAASCPYFAKLFKDIKTVRIDRLILEGLSAQSVASMLGYFYLATLIIDVEDVEDLLDAAYYFQTTEVIQLCTDYLELNLNINNCFVFYNISEKHNIEGLRAKTFQYICWNFNSIVKELRFLEICAETLMKVISSNSVKVKSEEEVYTAVWSWYRYNIEDRKYYLPKLVMYIHFEVMEAEFLENTVKKEMYLESELCRKKVDDALNMIKNKVDTDTRKICNYRQSSDNIYMFNSSSSASHMLDIKTCSCTPALELQLPKSMEQEHHVVVKAGKALLSLSKMSVMMFNVDTMNWNVVGEGREILDAGVCSTKSTIYVIGGKQPIGKFFWGFNIKSGRWEKLPDMEYDRRSPAVAVMGNTKPKIFVAGGYCISTTSVLQCMQFFVASESCWKTIKQTMSQPRFQASMIINNDKVYVVGGRSMEKSWDTVEYYDRATSKWRTCEGNLSEVKLESSLINFEGKIYCIGGKGCCSIELLEDNDKSKKWTYLGKLHEMMSGSHCVVYQPKEEKK